jgi:hypothetical protein
LYQQGSLFADAAAANPGYFNYGSFNDLSTVLVNAINAPFLAIYNDYDNIYEEGANSCGLFNPTNGFFSVNTQKSVGLALFADENLALVGDGGDAADVLATPVVENPTLKNIVTDLYRGTTNPGRVGMGTTADAVRSVSKLVNPPSVHSTALKRQNTQPDFRRYLIAVALVLTIKWLHSLFLTTCKMHLGANDDCL